MELTQMDDTSISKHLAPAKGHDFENDEFTRLTLDRHRSWFQVKPCPGCDGVHLIEWAGTEPTTFECDVTGTKYAVVPDGWVDPDAEVTE